MQNKKTMKSFDFPLIFKYIVGYLKIIENKDNEKHKIRQHISLPNRYPPQRQNQQPNLNPFNQTKQYSFGKKRLIEIRYVPSKPYRLQTQGSQTTQHKRTIFGDPTLRKLQSHRTHLTNPITDDKNNKNDKQSIKSIRSTMRNTDNNNKGNNSNNNSSVMLQKKKQQTLIQNITKNQQLLNNHNSSVVFSTIPINSDDNSNQSKLLQPLQTQIQPNCYSNANQQQSLNINSNKNDEIKKISNLMLRKQNGRKNLTKFYNNRQNQQLSYIGDEENDMSKATKKKTHLFQVSDDFSQKTDKGSLAKCGGKTGDGGCRRQSKKFQLLQDTNQRYLKRVSKRVNFQDNTFQTLDSQQNQSSDLQIQSQKAITTYQPFIRKASRIKTQKIFKKNIQIKKLKQKLKQQQYEEEYQEQMGYGYNRKIRVKKSPVRNSNNRMETNVFKKKDVANINTNSTTGNSMLVRRIKKSSEQDQIEIQQQSYDLVPQTTNLCKKPILFSKTSTTKPKPDTLNVFNELSNFHSLMQNIDGDGNDQRLSQIVSNKMLNMNSFKLMAEESNRMSDFYSERKKMFQSDEKLFKLSKRVINKANQLKQLQVL